MSPSGVGTATDRNARPRSRAGSEFHTARFMSASPDGAPGLTSDIPRVTESPSWLSMAPSTADPPGQRRP